MKYSCTCRRIVHGLVLVLLLATAPTWVSASATTDERLAWIALEEELEIRRIQFPDHYPAPLLLPDLRTMPPSDISLVIEEDRETRFLQFSNAVWNAGPGKLELHGAIDPLGETIRAVQVIDREDGKQLERPAGEFDFHSVHQHVHWDAFAQYQVWSTGLNGVLEEVLASSDKIGYCIRDIAPYPAPVEIEQQLDRPADPIPNQPGYTSCNWRRQGMSVGWYDIYYSYTAGQSLDISHLANGTYALLSIADPTHILREADEGNNRRVIYFNLQGEQIIILDM